MDDEIQTVVAEQGWNDSSLLGMALGFIREQGQEEAFVKFLRNVQSIENGA